MNYQPIYKYNCQLVREPSNVKMIPDSLVIQSVADAIDVVKILTSLDKSPCEQLWAVYLNCKLQVVGFTLVAQGGLSAAMFDMRNIFRTAILSNSKAVILAHNHPSGDAAPSEDDIKFTKDAVKAGRVLGIDVLDHIVVGLDRDVTSMNHSNLVKF